MLRVGSRKDLGFCKLRKCQIFDAGDICYSVYFQERKERKDLLKRLLNKGVSPRGDTSIPPVYEALKTRLNPFEGYGENS